MTATRPAPAPALGSPAWVVTLVLSLLAPLLALGATTAAAAPGDPPGLDVQLTAVRLGGTTPDSLVTLEGTVTNNATQPAYDVRVNLWRARQALTTRTQITAAFAARESPSGASYRSLPTSSVALTSNGAAFSPQASGRFSVSATLSQLGLPSGATYWIGANATASASPAQAVSRVGAARSLLTVPGDRPTQLTSVVELSSVPRVIKPGLFADDGLAQELTGRLDALLSAAGDRGVSYAIDPELYAAVQDMANGYQVVSGQTTRAGAGREAARQWLAKFAQLPKDTGFQLLYGRPDVTGAADLDDPGVLRRAKEATDASGLGLPVIASVTHLGEKGLRQLAAENIPILTSSLPAGRPWTRIGDARVVGAIVPGVQLADEAALPNTALNQNLARLALTQAAGTEVRVLRTAQDVATDRGSAPGWIERRTLGDLLETPPTAAALPKVRDPGTAVSPGLLRRTDALLQAMETYGIAAPRSGVGDARTAQASRLVSESWLGKPQDQEAYLAAMESRVGRDALRGGIRLSTTSVVTMTSDQSEFPVTVTNTLGDTITVRVAAVSDNSLRIDVSPSQETTIRPGDSETVPLAVAATGNGVVSVHFHVETLDERRLTPDQTSTVEATNLGAVGWIITIVSGVVLVVSTAWRIRQVQRQNRGKTRA
ncbi:DUF6049 family protein [Nigerium massiliense]|uniref:DUF6049 family protein n=1 Tax=Nigerium massiliense TaxID=1522317 RepID=UPI0005906F85|nr:DUF6049 family protein [Nigerium massiliense]